MGQALTSFSLQSPAESLRPGNPVSSDVINRIFKTLNPDPSTIHVLDCLCVDTSAPRNNLKKSFSLPPNTRLLVIPLHHKNVEHWTLGLADLKAARIEHYDSLELETVAHVAAEALLDLMAAQGRADCTLTYAVSRHVMSVHGQTANGVLKHLPQKQTGTSDCGVYILAYALHVMLRLPQPDRLHVPAWRAFFAASIDGAELKAHHRLPRPAHSITDANLLTSAQLVADASSLTLAQAAQCIQTRSIRQDWHAQVEHQMQLVNAILTTHQGLAAELPNLERRLKVFDCKDDFKETPQTYQHMVDQQRILGLRQSRVEVALRKIAVYSPSLEALPQHLATILKGLELNTVYHNAVFAEVKNLISQFSPLLVEPE